MKRPGYIRELALSVTLFVIFVSVPATSAAQGGPPSGLNVTVTNTSSNPVPVTGTVNVGSAVTGSVSITGTPSVSVTNTATNPVPTQNVGGGAATQVGQPASNLVSLLCNSKGCFPIARNGTASGSKFSVPAGQALVITDVQWVIESVRTQGSYDFTELHINSAVVAIFSALVDATSVSAGQAHLANAAVVTPGNSVSLFWPNADLPPTGEEPFGFLQGYLVPNQ
jgi:hypothetical protein